MRPINFREVVIAKEHRTQLLPLLASFDVCFEVEAGRFTFPSLLPCATREEVARVLGLAGRCTVFAGRSYSRADEEGFIPPVMVLSLFRTAVAAARSVGGRAVLLRAGLLVCVVPDCHVVVQFRGADMAVSGLDVAVLSRSDAGAELGVRMLDHLTLALAVLCEEQRVQLEKYVLTLRLGGKEEEDSMDVKLPGSQLPQGQIEHPLLGPVSVVEAACVERPQPFQMVTAEGPLGEMHRELWARSHFLYKDPEDRWSDWDGEPHAYLRDDSALLCTDPAVVRELVNGEDVERWQAIGLHTLREPSGMVAEGVSSLVTATQALAPPPFRQTFACSSATASTRSWKLQLQSTADLPRPATSWCAACSGTRRAC
jgi:hypothetical protein